MKRLTILLAAVLVLAAYISAVQHSANFTTAFALDASATKAVGSDFASPGISIPNNISRGLLTVTFARAAGSDTLKVKFYFQVSYDEGSTWSDYVDPITNYEYIEVLTGHGVISGTTVRVSQYATLAGITHIRLSKVVNGDSGNNLTAVNAALSF